MKCLCFRTGPGSLDKTLFCQKMLESKQLYQAVCQGLGLSFQVEFLANLCSWWEVWVSSLSCFSALHSHPLDKMYVWRGTGIQELPSLRWGLWPWGRSAVQCHCGFWGGTVSMFLLPILPLSSCFGSDAVFTGVPSVVNRLVVLPLFVAEQLPYLGIVLQMSHSPWPGHCRATLGKGVCDLLSGVNVVPFTRLT